VPVFGPPCICDGHRGRRSGRPEGAASLEVALKSCASAGSDAGGANTIIVRMPSSRLDCMEGRELQTGNVVARKLRAFLTRRKSRPTHCTHGADDVTSNHRT